MLSVPGLDPGRERLPVVAARHEAGCLAARQPVGGVAVEARHRDGRTILARNAEDARTRVFGLHPVPQAGGLERARRSTFRRLSRTCQDLCIRTAILHAVARLQALGIREAIARNAEPRRVATRQHRRVTRAGLGEGVGEGRIGEHPTLALQPTQARGLCFGQTIRAKLIDGQQHNELRSRFGQVRGARTAEVQETEHREENQSSRQSLQ